MAIKEITPKTISIYNSLETLNDPTLIKCLESFNKNFHFTEWLRKEIKDLKSLNLLCEFAGESDNEGALEVVRVQSLSMVGTAYSPLIFDLKIDFSYKNLIEQVNLVKKNLRKNPKLPEKMVNYYLFLGDKYLC